MTRHFRAYPERLTLGQAILNRRHDLGLTAEDVFTHINTGKAQITAIENASKDVLLGTFIDVAGAVGLSVALVGEHHLPLLDLTADEVKALAAAAEAWQEIHPYATVRSALDKLTTTEEG